MKTIFAIIAIAATIGATAAQAGMGWKNGSTLQGTYYQGVNMQGTVYQGVFYQGSQYQGSFYQATQYQGTMRQGSQMQGATAGQITIGSDNLVSIELPR